MMSTGAAAANQGFLEAQLEKFYAADGPGRDEIIAGFRAAADEAVYPLLDRAVRNNENDRLRNAAMEIYIALRGRSIPVLVALLGDRNEEVRTFCGVMLGSMKDSRAVPALINALADADMNVKHAAAEALGKIGDRRAVDPLIAALATDMWLQFPAAIALGEIGDARAVAPLVGLLPLPGANVPAIQALGKLAHPTALEPLSAFLEDEEAALREWALEAVAEIFSKNPALQSSALSPRAEQILIEMLSSDRPLVRKNAALALGFFRASGAAAVLQRFRNDEELREAAEAALLRIEGRCPDREERGR